MVYTDPWEAFGEANRPDVVCDFTSNVAADVCDTFGLVCATPGLGGTLDGIDIKQMDAMTVIRLSLLEEAADSNVFYEPIVNAYGEVEFKQIGGRSPSLDVYYTVQTHTYKEEVSGVMVTGKKPMTYRRPIEWKDLFETAGGYRIWDTFDLIDNCNAVDFAQTCIITYNDPHLSTSFEDGIDNLYEITKDNPYDSVLGYAYKLLPPADIENRDDISITIENSCEVPYPLVAKGVIANFGDSQGPIPDIGTLEPRRYLPDDDSDCWVDRGVEVVGGIEIEIPSELRFETVRGVRQDKLLGVSAVFAIGTKCKTCMGIPRDDAAASGGNSQENTQLWIAVDEVEQKAFKLEEGTHYIVNYEGTDVTNKKVKLKFANNARFNDLAGYGTNVDFKLLPGCRLHSSGKTFSGYSTGSDGSVSGKGTILPTGGVSGIWVYEIVVMLALDSPCVKVVDPQGGAERIARELKILVGTMVAVNEPSPVAKNGELIDLVDGIIDHDPTTTQNLQDTALEIATRSMAAGQGLSMNLSFLDEDGVRNLSKTLYDYMSAGDGAETTYVCGPDTIVELGDRGDAGGVINSISYSYSDQGSYTISVNEGPYIIGGSEGISGAAYTKQTESFSAQGTIIQDEGNHTDFKVRVDGFGDVYALNCTPAILRVGDIVNVSLHNNPVES